MQPPPNFSPDNTDNTKREIMQGITKLLLALAAVVLLMLDLISNTSQDLRKILSTDIGAFSYLIYVVDFYLFWMVAKNSLSAWWLFFPHPAPERK